MPNPRHKLIAQCRTCLEGATLGTPMSYSSHPDGIVGVELVMERVQIRHLDAPRPGWFPRIPVLDCKVFTFRRRVCNSRVTHTILGWDGGWAPWSPAPSRPGRCGPRILQAFGILFSFPRYKNVLLAGLINHHTDLWVPPANLGLGLLHTSGERQD